MNTNNVSNNTVPEDSYRYYGYSSECTENEKQVSVAETVQYHNLCEKTLKTPLLLNIEQDKVSVSKDIRSSVLEMAKKISEDTKKFKNDYYEQAFKLKDSNQKNPNIKNYMEVAKQLKPEEAETKIDEKMVRANSTDCSGFIKMLYEENGMSLQPKILSEEKKLIDTYGSKSERFRELDRGAELIRRSCANVNADNVKPGDLIFFKDIKSTTQNNNGSGLKLTDYATHIGIVSQVKTDNNGDKQILFIHKSSNGGVVESDINSRARTNQKVNYSDLNPTFGRIE